MKKLLLITVFTLWSFAGFTQIIENPVFDRTDIPQFHIDKIEFAKDSTFVYCSCSAEENSWANISSETYLEDTISGIKYTVLKVEGLPFAPSIRQFYFAEEYKIKLVFPSLKAVAKLNFVENPKEKAFNVYGINLSESNDSTYRRYSLDKANALSASASYYNSIKNYDKAIESEELAMCIRRYWLGRHNEMYDHSVYMLGHYYSMSRNYEKAEHYLNESVIIREKIYGNDKETYVDALTMLATCYANQDQVMKAIQTFEQAISLIDKNNTSYTRAKSLLARAYFAIGDIPKAIDYTEDVVRINKVLVGEKDEEYLYPLFDLAKWYMWTDKAKSKSICEKLMSIINCNYGKRHTLYLYVINILSQYYLLQKETEKALAYGKESMELSLDTYGNESVEYGLSLNIMAQIYESLLHDYDKSIQYRLESLSILKPEMGFDTYSKTLKYIAQLFAKKEDYSNALQYATEAIKAYKDDVIPEFGKMSDEQKYSLWQMGHFLFDTGYPFYVYKNQNEVCLSGLYDNILFSKGITLKELVSEQYTWRNIQSKLKKEDVAIEFIESYEQDTLVCHYALLLKKDYNSPKIFRLFDTSQFERLILSNNTIYDRNVELGQLIWGTLKDELDGIENIFFSPAGLFHSIAIEHLPIDNHVYYSNKYNIYRLSSTKDILNTGKQKIYKCAILFGGLDYSSELEVSNSSQGTSRNGYEYLANTKEEVELISDVLTRNNVNNFVYNGLNGTEKTFKQLHRKNFDILHLATHGEYVRPENVEMMRKKDHLDFLQGSGTNQYIYESDALSWSFLLLSGGNKLINREKLSEKDDDGILSALEISSLTFSNLDLVVLSACKTALGYGGVDSSVLGLQKAFKRAGANTILMSLEKVDDEATKILMVEFYRNLMSGKTKHQSLKDAQKYLRSVENGKYDDPKYWASFIMLDGLN